MSALKKHQLSKLKYYQKTNDGDEIRIEASGKAADNISSNLARKDSRVPSACHNRKIDAVDIIGTICTLLSIVIDIIGLFMCNYFLRGTHEFHYLQSIWS